MNYFNCLVYLCILMYNGYQYELGKHKREKGVGDPIADNRFSVDDRHATETF